MRIVGLQSARKGIDGGQDVSPEPVTLTVATEREKALLRRIGRLEHRLSNREQYVAGKDVVCVVPVSNGDAGLAIELFEWMADLGGHPDHTCVVWTQHGMADRLKKTLVASAEDAWGSVILGSTPFDLYDEGWPRGANWMFSTVAQWCYEQRLDFMIVEPDAVPLKPQWFQQIVGEYRRCGRPFMGTVEDAREKCPAHMPGNAVYPWNVWEYGTIGNMTVAWDVALAEVIMDDMAVTRRIQQFWGITGLPPSFPDRESLKIIKPEAMLFHRCKNGSLIRQLRGVL